jgi:hypothetical protein
MERPNSPVRPWWLPARLAGLLGGRYRRFVMLVTLTYCAALAGLAVTFVEGTAHPESALSAVGIALLFASFLGLFYLSVTLLSVVETGR